MTAIGLLLMAGGVLFLWSGFTGESGFEELRKLLSGERAFARSGKGLSDPASKPSSVTPNTGRNFPRGGARGRGEPEGTFRPDEFQVQ